MVEEEGTWRERGSSPRRGGGWGGDGKSGGRDCMLNFGVGSGAILEEGCGCERLGGLRPHV